MTNTLRAIPNNAFAATVAMDPQTGLPKFSMLLSNESEIPAVSLAAQAAMMSFITYFNMTLDEYGLATSAEPEADQTNVTKGPWGDDNE